MRPDDEVCLCFHVTQRKLKNYLRVENIVRPSQLSECQGAGTGCGWCVPYLKKLFEHSQHGTQPDLPSTETYSSGRKEYIRQGKGSPPE